MNNLFLISNSISFGQNYLDHCMRDIVSYLGTNKKITFVPYALKNHEDYTTKVKKRFEQENIEITSLHEVSDKTELMKKTTALFIGGGNTFRLLHTLYELDILKVIKAKFEHNELLYIGSSAGVNVTCPTIKTTNDMPIIYPPSFNALSLISIQINPHFIDKQENSTHMGETREERIKDFHEDNKVIVMGLREGAYLEGNPQNLELKGLNGAKLFFPEGSTQELRTGEQLDLDIFRV